MSGKRRPSFVDGYLVQRLREHSREEETYSHSQPASTLDGERYGSRHEGLWAKPGSIIPQSDLLLAPKSEGPTLHSLTAARKGGRISTQSNESTLLKKRYRYNVSVPVAAKITADTSAPTHKKKASHLPPSSPSASGRGYRKIRRGYSTMKNSPPFLNGLSCGSGKRSSSLGGVSRTTPVGVSRRNHDFPLPLVGQRSDELQRGKSHEQDYLKRPSHCNVSQLRIGEKGDVKLPPSRLKKSYSAGAGVGGASGWGCDGVRGWRSACEDTREDLVATLAEDSLSIEDATDESVAETEGEAVAGLGEEGVGFSVEDLTDLEEDGDTTTGTASPSAVDYLPPYPLPCDSDLATYSLIKKASQQLELLSIASDSGGSSSSDTSHSPDLPRSRRHRKTKRTSSGPNRTTPAQGLAKTDHTEQQKFDQRHNERPDLAGPSTITEIEAMALREKIAPPLPSPPLTPSLFPSLGPTIHFPMPNEPYTPLPPDLISQLKWKMSTITPNIIKNCIARVGFTPCTKDRGWLGYWGKHMRSGAFRAVQGHQKVNHFPGSFEIGRKDRLWRNLSRLQSRVGRKNLDFVPLTFVLPHDLRLLKREWETKESSSRQKWILKPPAAARGIGVRVIHRWSQIPKKRPVIVQKYLADPLLIGGNKIDLRVYVYVSSYDPLMIYVFPDGLTRFATCKYSSSTRSLSNRFIHLTNYSVNKKNSQFSQNSDETACQGHKWGLLALWKYVSCELGTDTNAVWRSIVELVIKTIICSEPHCSTLVKTYVQNSYSCHELFGFDVILDRKLKPWLVEVNISPSLHSNSKLDVNIKGQLVRDLLNIAGFKLPATAERTAQCGLTVEDKQKHSHFLQRNLPEFARRGMFERVYPTHESGKYRKYFESEKYNNILLEQWVMKYQHSRDRGIELLRKLS
ncbi:Tubulin polyglutamylase TTLL4 [Geodia barretti]|uniref:Tubulin polyglutamylase TTLL4 n=1 Tax=Geodia barretti TaxID=519541 RepID=A0AA35SQX1_GEOBA|nr:Tubulin polyglutamylase TTLL4 [Geodia barretti]